MKSVVRDKYSAVFWLLLSGIGAISLGSAFLFLGDPRNPAFFFSLFQLEEHWKYAFLPIEMFGICIASVNSALYGVMAVIVVATANYWINECRYLTLKPSLKIIFISYYLLVKTVDHYF
jgi:hypothetical protein